MKQIFGATLAAVISIVGLYLMATGPDWMFVVIGTFLPFAVIGALCIYN